MSSLDKANGSWSVLVDRSLAATVVVAALACHLAGTYLTGTDLSVSTVKAIELEDCHEATTFYTHPEIDGVIELGDYREATVSYTHPELVKAIELGDRREVMTSYTHPELGDRREVMTSYTHLENDEASSET